MVDWHSYNESLVRRGQDFDAETVFSSIKGTFGEHVTARKFHNMVNEILPKATLYNMFMSNIANGCRVPH